MVKFKFKNIGGDDHSNLITFIVDTAINRLNLMNGLCKFSNINLGPNITNFTLLTGVDIALINFSMPSGVTVKFNSQVLDPSLKNIISIDIGNINETHSIQIGDNSTLWINPNQIESISFSDNSSLNVILNDEHYYINTPSPFLTTQNHINWNKLQSLKRFLNKNFNDSDVVDIELDHTDALKEYQHIQKFKTNLIDSKIIKNVNKNIFANFFKYSGVHKASLSVDWLENVASFLNLDDIFFSSNISTIQIEMIDTETVGEVTTGSNFDNM